MLKEVHYLQSRAYENIPPGALDLYARRDQLRKYVINLDLTIYYYNKIRQTVLEVEYPLIENQLSDIDKKLLRAENSLTWNSEGQLSIILSPIVMSSIQIRQVMYNSKMSFCFSKMAANSYLLYKVCCHIFVMLCGCNNLQNFKFMARILITLFLLWALEQ